MTSSPTSRMRPRTARAVDARSLIEAVAARLGTADVEVAGDAEVTGVALDSRAVQPGDLWVALPGAARHGADFAPAVIAAGASCIVTDEAGRARVEAAAAEAGRAVALAVVPSGLRAWAGPLAAEVFGTGERAFPLFAVTGTNGKTTTTYMLNSLQRALGRSTGVIGTIEIRAGEEAIPSVLTTPESPDVHGILARMAENGVTGAAMEVSSHAIDYRRVDGIRFDVAGFTNLTQDHLDLHGTMEEYFASKAQLFEPARSAAAVILADGEWGHRMAEAARAAGAVVVTLSLEGEADARVTDVAQEGLGSRFTLEWRGERLEVVLPLPGAFNVANAALAVTMLLASGVSAAQLAPVLADGSGLAVTVPGRMQVIGTSPAAIVDFAHNPDALERALASVAGERRILVFGATGDRDPSKRHAMGRIAAEGADIVIVTDDDPHGEDPASIRAAVLEGARAAGTGASIEEVHPRADAIARAVELAGPKDAILVAGRGHETVQDVAGVDIPLDDREELAAALRRAGYPTLDQTTRKDGAEC
ncbi:UDP-N-acetylmuramoyl-L-alanyl-D-glutamate--2,6-diaminopimelate ligase [Falsarthrobacter nasiphocae]|uniref:UDP-N-acetylmuramyl-tripeptide synthetase n=1 Tax=Falsarthrobacter nasiphocae TaxID=189863 RepID=A0AAE4C5B3_9MICC|nr:UDP-N-acetylmuramoyl-L-alanyl-D-glutamate--2,6-diaminopimelate ligase [Falsarthrobacter nasiphocae]MDR6891323.1 UDP-N-acetylmuramoyl-L-alanyl-D-glutamate--2,6-diaminopimelate ligase [Falsarthrobacter nasiphocae]